MQRHRFSHLLSSRITDYPEETSPQVSPAGFAMVPSGLMAVFGAVQGWQADLFRRAYEEALAVVRPSLPERDLLGVWN